MLYLKTFETDFGRINYKTTHIEEYKRILRILGILVILVILMVSHCFKHISESLLYLNIQVGVLGWLYSCNL